MMQAIKTIEGWIKGPKRRWHGVEFDADPFVLPAHVAVPAQSAAKRMLGFIRFASVGRDGVDVVDSSPMLGHFTWKELLTAYKGIALRTAMRGRHDQRSVVLIEMIHKTRPERAIVLHVSFDGADVAARWRSWSNVLGLPLMIERKNGDLEFTERRLGSLKVDSPQPHAGANPLTLRRPMTFGATGRPRVWTERLCAGSRPHLY